MTTDARKTQHGIRTRFLVISDTHGIAYTPGMQPQDSVDVAIHCGDLTEHSKLSEFQSTLTTIRGIKASLKLVIAGNHDFSLDPPVFRKKIAEARRLADSEIEDALIEKEYGVGDESKRVLEDTRVEDIVFLNEGSHSFVLPNGAALSVYSSPYTPSNGGGWAFQYTGDHDFNIQPGTDIVITHGPPHGIMDMTLEKTRIGCPQLFAAVARAQPKIHCFGHVHNGWGAKLVSWRPVISETPSHFCDVDNATSMAVESLSALRGSRFESEEEAKLREERVNKYRSRKACSTSHCPGDERPLGPRETIFVNAALKGDNGLDQLAWLVEIVLPQHCANKGATTLVEGGEGDENIKRKRPSIDSSQRQELVKHLCTSQLSGGN